MHESGGAWHSAGADCPSRGGSARIRHAIPGAPTDLVYLTVGVLSHSSVSSPPSSGAARSRVDPSYARFTPRARRRPAGMNPTSCAELPPIAVHARRARAQQPRAPAPRHHHAQSAGSAWRRHSSPTTSRSRPTGRRSTKSDRMVLRMEKTPGRTQWMAIVSPRTTESCYQGGSPGGWRRRGLTDDRRAREGREDGRLD